MSVTPSFHSIKLFLILTCLFIICLRFINIIASDLFSLKLILDLLKTSSFIVVVTNAHKWCISPIEYCDESSECRQHIDLH